MADPIFGGIGDGMGDGMGDNPVSWDVSVTGPFIIWMIHTDTKPPPGFAVYGDTQVKPRFSVYTDTQQPPGFVVKVSD